MASSEIRKDTTSAELAFSAAKGVIHDLMRPLAVTWNDISNVLQLGFNEIKPYIIPFYDYQEHLCWSAIVDGAIAGAVMGAPLGLGFCIYQFQGAQRGRRLVEKAYRNYFIPKEVH